MQLTLIIRPQYGYRGERMPLTLQKEHPADSDLFRGKSHKKVALKMTRVIETSEINIRGLEGELCSGKSTIINDDGGDLIPFAEQGV